MPQIDNRTSYPVNGATAEAIRELAIGYTKTVVTTTYTILAADIGVDLFFSNSSAITVTVPSGLDSNFRCRIFQDSTGQVTVQAGSGVTLNAYSGWTKLAGQHAGANLTHRASEVYNLAGNLSA
jgi:hypothetical protein